MFSVITVQGQWINDERTELLQVFYHGELLNVEIMKLPATATAEIPA